MNPHPPPPGGNAFGSPPRGAPQGPPPPRGRYGTGLVAVLAVIAILAGASFLGGGLALGGVVTSRIAADRESDPRPSPSPSPSPTPEESPSPTEDPLPGSEPAEEPSDLPTEEPREKVTVEEVISELSGDYGMNGGRDVTDDLCDGGEEETLSCTSAMDTNVARVIDFDDILTASIVIVNLRSQAEEDDNDMVDAQNACHIVFIWFEGGDTDQSERDDMTRDARSFAGC
ncbi:hypothetical protein KGD82_04215 [Nocardiopsis eucommiae]|uniref:Uncharacterized protein n=1 Tax=Nocardiopsis eucommiae TaxID=2831970 RepID=A0A975LBF0_9ACTN|nr:hypothetical protein KGD82_04215 [Nocardiopsis eucommiae]